MSQVPLLPGLSLIDDKNVQNVFSTLIDYLNQQDNGIQTVSAFVDRGTQVNDSALPGNVGEYIESVVGAVNLPSSGNLGDLTSISLTAGDWDLTGLAIFGSATLTNTNISLGISSTSGNSSTGLVLGSNYAGDVVSPVAGATNGYISIPNYRVSLSSAQTYYLKFGSTYTGTGATAVGRLSARRMR